jgi:hypothetical protein
MPHLGCSAWVVEQRGGCPTVTFLSGCSGSVPALVPPIQCTSLGAASFTRMLPRHCWLWERTSPGTHQCSPWQRRCLTQQCYVNEASQWRWYPNTRGFVGAAYHPLLTAVRSSSLPRPVMTSGQAVQPAFLPCCKALLIQQPPAMRSCIELLHSAVPQQHSMEVGGADVSTWVGCTQPLDSSRELY